MNYESKFNEATTDDEDNEFEQMEEIIKKLEQITKYRKPE